MEDEEFSDGISVTSSAIRQPLPAHIDVDSQSELPAFDIDADNQSAIASEKFEGKGVFCEQSVSSSLPGVDIGGLKARPS